MDFKKRILWNDCETTGTDKKRCAIHQLAFAVEQDREIIASKIFYMRPHADALIDPKALEVSGKTIDEIQQYPSPQDVYVEINEFLDKYGFRKVKHARYIPAGYNNIFDLDLMSAYFERMSGGPYAFWDHLQYLPIDPYPTVINMWRAGIVPTINCQLGNVCEHFGIPIQAHDAMSDLLATRELAYKILLPYYSQLAGREVKSLV